MIKKLIKKIFFGKDANTSSNKPLSVSFREILGFDIDNEFILRQDSIPFLLNLKNKGKAVFSKENNVLFIQIDGSKFQVNTWEELLILNEVFIEGTYNFETQNDYALIDIGMNVGITTLFFNKKEKCRQIFSFEPFVETIKDAEANIAMNQPSDKINIHNFGLGYPARTLNVPYSAKYKGSVGINGVADFIRDGYEQTTSELKVVDVYEVIENIKSKTPYELIFKIDCEGAEYEILQRMDETGIIKYGRIYMIEWHTKGPQELENIFKKNNYSVLSFNPKNSNIGMLYAVKS